MFPFSAYFLSSMYIHRHGKGSIGLQRIIIHIVPTPVGKLYGRKDFVEERHRHRYEVNPDYVKDLEAQGMRFVGHSTDGQRMEIMELQGIVRTRTVDKQNNILM